ncbi:hypothetical protein DM860_007913 [Cuscuta australis]|uniref:WPP domain-associated protein n=1 Tax=Cuscuta australis TaxID=267555 RepID=A0A328E0T5_9ASTE|nr:hypothetical protein DM860_007913 [Cuscuta australis]
MEGQEVLENGVVGNGVAAKSSFSSGELGGIFNGVKEGMNLGDDILQDFDLYWDDISGRLMVSRMVSDSVIKGMVGAVEQEAAEKVRAKEMEMAKLKEDIQFCVTEVNGVGRLGSYALSDKQESVRHFTFSGGFMENGEMMDTLIRLRGSVKEQFEKLKKDIYDVKEHHSLRRIGSSSELVGLSGILQENKSESWGQVDKTMNRLKMTVDSVFVWVDDTLRLSKSSVVELQKEKDLQGELENMVMQNLLRSFLEDFESKLWDQNTPLCNKQIDKLSEIAMIRADLDGIFRSLPSAELGNLTSHGSHDMDTFQNKVSRDHVTPPKSQEENGKIEDSSTDVPKNFETAQLKHLSKEDLVSYFNNMIIKMKRDHESILQAKTEELFTLKAEFLRLRERGSYVPHKKDKELDVLRKKIPEVLSKLDDILFVNEKCPSIPCKDENICNLKNRLESLLSENCRLRDSLAHKKNEVNVLSSQISDATEKMHKHSMAEMKMQKLIDNLNLAVQDVDIEASIREEVYKCFIRELREELYMQLHMAREFHEAIFKEAAVNSEGTSITEIGDSDCESLIMQEMFAVIYGEAVMDFERSFKELCGDFLRERDTRICLELQASQRENDFALEADEKFKLKEELVALKKLLEEKDRVATVVSTALEKERNQFDLVSQELNSLREQLTNQNNLASENSKELNLVKGQLVEASNQIEVFKEKANLLNQKLEQKVEELKEADDQRRMALALSEERQSNLLSLEAREKDLRTQMDAIKGTIHELSTMLAEFELKVAKRSNTNGLRLEHSQTQLKSLLKKANLLRKRALVCQQTLEKRSSDLQLAEAEVDLLGDQVDVLLGLLEKIYIALDHYSPILQHYPGVIEILKLIRRELSGEYTKAV